MAVGLVAEEQLGGSVVSQSANAPNNLPKSLDVISPTNPFHVVLSETENKRTASKEQSKLTNKQQTCTLFATDSLARNNIFHCDAVVKLQRTVPKAPANFRPKVRVHKVSVILRAS